MKYLRAFYTRVCANKVPAGMGLSFGGSLIAIRWPQLYSWLPPEFQRQISSIAYYTIGTMLTGLFFWVKTHGNVGDPANINKPDTTPPAP